MIIDKLQQIGGNEYDDLLTATEAFLGVKKSKLIFISESGSMEAVRRRAGEELQFGPNSAIWILISNYLLEMLRKNFENSKKVFYKARRTTYYSI